MQLSVKTFLLAVLYILISLSWTYTSQSDQVSNRYANGDIDEYIKTKLGNTSNNFHDSVFTKLLEDYCPTNTECSKLTYPCIDCTINKTCIYGHKTPALCHALFNKCIGSKTFEKLTTCQYCYQSNENEHRCKLKPGCNSSSMPRQYYRANCTVNNDIICLGHRAFMKNIRCNWTAGHRWSVAVFLSLTLGGFGADRFYLGYWQEGIGKLFSFGGLGVWTILDFLLIAIQYLGPADGSLYI